MMRGTAAACTLIVALMTTACGERVQTVASGSEKKADTPGWQSNISAFRAPGWTPGDRASWEAQLRNRAQGQNDFAVPTK